MEIPERNDENTAISEIAPGLLGEIDPCGDHTDAWFGREFLEGLANDRRSDDLAREDDKRVRGIRLDCRRNTIPQPLRK